MVSGVHGLMQAQRMNNGSREQPGRRLRERYGRR
eukprot:gene756-7223_t